MESNIKHQCVLMHVNYTSNFKNKVRYPLVSFSGFFQRRQWQPTPVLLPGKSHGWRSLVGCSPWGR